MERGACPGKVGVAEGLHKKDIERASECAVEMVFHGAQAEEKR